MKTKLTLLAATLIVGFSVSNAPASPPNWDFYATKVTPAVQTAHAARSPGFKACFETRASVTTGPNKGGAQAMPSHRLQYRVQHAACGQCLLRQRTQALCHQGLIALPVRQTSDDLAD